jgi:hypothetical protein
MVIRSRRKRWVTREARMGEEKCAKRIPFGTVILNPMQYGLIEN